MGGSKHSSKSEVYGNEHIYHTPRKEKDLKQSNFTLNGTRKESKLNPNLAKGRKY